MSGISLFWIFKWKKFEEVYCEDKKEVFLWPIFIWRYLWLKK
jgi:hypothetical protein